MKALSIRQPWAWAILHAGKRIENRDWRAFYRGPILLHASKGMTHAEYESCLEFYRRISGDLAFPTFPAFDALPRGGVVGRARIVDCVTASTSPWFFGRYGFVLDDVEPLPFRPLKGALGFFDLAEPSP